MGALTKSFGRICESETNVGIRLDVRVIVVVIVLISSRVLGQSPSYIQHKPIQPDFTPYLENQIRQAEMLRELEFERQRREAASKAASRDLQLNRIRDVESYYESFASYPDTIPDGWHSVVVVDKSRGNCFDGEVEVVNNRIIAVPNAKAHFAPTPIVNGRATIRIAMDGTQYFFTNYFLDALEVLQR